MGIAKSRNALLIAALAIGLLSAAPADALQCVPYARVASGIDLRGDAWKWWNAAAGTYERGHAPRVGAVLVFRKHGHMKLGHVAVIRRLYDSRTVMIDHANWGPRGAGRGTVSKMVPLRDVSPRNDWSQVQVWNSITRDFGTQSYPTYGFIYARGGAQISSGTYVGELPDNVAAVLASASTIEPQPDTVPGLDVAVATAIQPIEAQPMPETRYETLNTVAIQPPQRPTTPAQDRAAAQRAGSRHY